MGVQIRNTEALEIRCQFDTLVADKTGTLTEGKPKLLAAEPTSGFDAQTRLRMAASLEQACEHPLAAAMSLNSVSIIASALRLRWVGL